MARNLDAVPAERIADFVLDVHDAVNIKLDKPAAVFPARAWKRYQMETCAEKGYGGYVDDLFFFLFTLALNYPVRFLRDTQLQRRYREFFDTLPQAMVHRPFGQTMARYMIDHPLRDEVELDGREALFWWVYDMYRAVFDQRGKERQTAGNRIHDADTVRKSIEAMRRK